MLLPLLEVFVSLLRDCLATTTVHGGIRTEPFPACSGTEIAEGASTVVTFRRLLSHVRSLCSRLPVGPIRIVVRHIPITTCRQGRRASRKSVRQLSLNGGLPRTDNLILLDENILLLLALLQGQVQLFYLLLLSLKHGALSMNLAESLSLVLKGDLFHSGHFAAQALELAGQDPFNQV